MDDAGGEYGPDDPSSEEQLLEWLNSLSPEQYEQVMSSYKQQMQDSGGGMESVLPTGRPVPSWSALVRDCIRPVIFGDGGDTHRTITYIIALCLLQRLVNNFSFLPTRAKCASAGLLGVYLIYSTMDTTTLLSLISLFFTFHCVLLLVDLYNESKKGNQCKSSDADGTRHDPLCTIKDDDNDVVKKQAPHLIIKQIFIVAAAILLLLQMLVSSHQYTRSRGACMILVMKMVSEALDRLSSKEHSKNIDLVVQFGYCFDVSSVLFGPWMSFAQFNAHLQQFPATFLTQLKSVVVGLVKWVFAVLFLLYSVCILDWLIPDSWGQHSRWLISYRDAQAFRTSHYFVSLLAEASVLLTGAEWGSVMVTSPLAIELPRSLVEVVVNWNFPMHRWLRIYVFKSERERGTAWAIFATYMASSFLHGMDFQLSAVLLSLGIYTYAEHVLRTKLAKIYDACICARRCKTGCAHSYGWRHPLVLLANVVFLLLSVFHLVYLGAPFVNVDGIAEKGFGWRHTHKIWSNLGYLSHIIGAITFYIAWSL